MIADGENCEDIARTEPSARYVHLGGKHSIGAKRNLGCELSRGEVIAHWDDDDYSAPGRLADQIQRLTESGKAVTGYNVMRFVRFSDKPEWWEYTGHGRYALGTSLCYRRSWWQSNRFPELDVGEDNLFVSRAAAHNQLTVAPSGDLLWASIHAQNTSARQLNSSCWRKIDS